MPASTVQERCQIFEAYLGLSEGATQDVSSNAEATSSGSGSEGLAELSSSPSASPAALAFSPMDFHLADFSSVDLSASPVAPPDSTAGYDASWPAMSFGQATSYSTPSSSLEASISWTPNIHPLVESELSLDPALSWPIPSQSVEASLSWVEGIDPFAVPLDQPVIGNEPEPLDNTVSSSPSDVDITGAGTPSPSISRRRSGSWVKPAKTLSCALCDQTFPTTSNLGRHQREKHGQVRFQCDRCGKDFSRKDYLNRHPCKRRPLQSAFRPLAAAHLDR